MLNQPELQLVAFLTRWCVDASEDTVNPVQLKQAAKMGNRSALLRLAKYLKLHVGDDWSNGRIARLIAWRTSPRRRLHHG